MFVAFCAKSTMNATIQCLGVLDRWKDTIAIMEQSFSTKKNGVYVPEMRTSSLKDK
jgi:hypothetical protein